MWGTKTCLLWRLCWYRSCLCPYLPICLPATAILLLCFACIGLWPEGSQIYPNLFPKLGWKVALGWLWLTGISSSPTRPLHSLAGGKTFPLQNHLQWGAERSYCWFHFVRKAKSSFSWPSDLSGPFPALYKKTLKSRLLKMDKDAAGSGQGICVEKMVGLTLLPHPDWQRLRKQCKYICVCSWHHANLLTSNNHCGKTRHSLTVGL